MRLVDLSSFYAETGGGVRTYHRAKLAFFEQYPEHRHALIIAGERNRRREVAGGTVYEVRGFPVARGGAYRQIYDLHEVARILRHEAPDVIEIGSAYLDCWLALLGKRGRSATVGFYHADFPDSYMAPAVRGLPPAIARRFVGLGRRYVRTVYNLFDATCVASRYVGDKLGALGVRNVIRVPLGVDTALFDPRRRSQRVRRALGAGPGERVVLYCGRFREEKGIETLIEGVRRLASVPGLRFVFVGAGPLEAQVRSLKRAEPRVHVVGHVDDQERLAEIYAAADLYVAPGPHETFGLGVLEAMSAGVPVVAAGSGGAAEIVRQVGGGRCFTPHDAGDLTRVVMQSLAEARGDLARSGGDPRHIRHIVTQQYDWNRTFSRMVAAYEELVDAKKTRIAGATRRDAGLWCAGRAGAALAR